MQERHTDREKYFREQETTVRNHVLPFISEVLEINAQSSVLEIGCGEGGNLKPFMDLGCERVVGVDMAPGKVANAKAYFAGHPNQGNLELIVSNIYDTKDIGQFDIIIMRDVLEHIHGQERFMEFARGLLKPKGRFFLGFPPWHNPFGGHQQICESRVLSKLPFFHILPRPIYAAILKGFGETKTKVTDLLEIKQTGITIERFERILKRTNYVKDKRTFYLVNPNYEAKFGLKPRKQWRLISSIPYLRNFLITTNYYLVSLGAGPDRP